MKCPLAEAFTKTSSVLYQNFLKEFWCTAIAYDPSPPSDDSMARPLKEYLIKFSVITCKNPLAFSFRTFCTSTGLDYNKGNYVAHPSPEVVKAKICKIVMNESYLDKTFFLKNFFSVAWRILFTFVIQKKKGKSQTVSKPKPKAQRPEALGLSALKIGKKRLRRKRPPTSKGLPSTASKDVIALLLYNDELIKESEDDVFEAGDEMDEDTRQVDEEETQSPKHSKDSSTGVPTKELVSQEHQSPSPQREKLESSHAKDSIKASDSESSSCSETFRPYDNFVPVTERHEEAAASFANLKSEIERFHDDAYKVHKGNEAAFNSFEKLFTKLCEQANKDVEKIFSSLKEIQDAVKEDHVLNKKVIEATKALHLILHIYGLVPLPRMTQVELTQAAIQSDVTSLKKDTSDIKSMIAEIFYAFKGQTPSLSIVPTKTLAIIEADMDTEEIVVKELIKEPKAKKESSRPRPSNTIPSPQPKSPLVVPKADRRKGKVTNDTDKPIRKLVPASRKAHLDKEEMIKKATEEAKLLDMSKPELIKVV
ncbi:hypothetical protein Tco_0506797 [Tanacetum coccineum]